MILQLLLVTAGFILLYYGAEWLVKGASIIALNLNVSKVVIGVTLVAFGTSSPELFVNLNAAFRGNTGLALSNVAGSNLTNLCIGFGLCAFMCKLRIPKKPFLIDLTYFWVSPLFILFFFFLYPRGALPFWTFVPFAFLFFLYLFTITKRLKAPEKNDLPKVRLAAGIALFILGCVLLFSGGELVRYSAIIIARLLEVSQSTIGLTMVAMGTSIPDVMASLIAARRGETAIAIGNLLGSNIFNILLVLGGTTLVSFQDIPADTSILWDYVLVGGTSLLFAVSVLLSPRFGRIRGAFFLLVFPAYLIVRLLLL
jgi:cation:H+ antiporter